MAQALLQIAVFCALLVVAMPLLGGYMARVFTGERVFLTPVLGPLERLAYRLLRADPGHGQSWKQYARSLLVLSLVFWLALYLILRTQSLHPWNPQGFHSGAWDLSFNTTSSFITNTNWQYYGGETTLSYFSQMAGLAVQNFVSAAAGMAVLAAFIRGIAARSGRELGSFYPDLIRTTLYILVPLSIVVALILVSQGVIQTLEGPKGLGGLAGANQTLALGPAASQIAIKQLGTNGGGFFNVNSAFPFENPTWISNFLEVLSILVISGALCYTFGVMVGDTRQGWAVLAAMTVIFAGLRVVSVAAE